MQNMSSSLNRLGGAEIDFDVGATFARFLAGYFRKSVILSEAKNLH